LILVEKQVSQISEPEGNGFAKAYLGDGSVTIETVRMIKAEDSVVDLTPSP